MTREPAFDAPESAHTLKHLQDTIDHTLHRIAALGPGADTSALARSLTIAFDMHARAVAKEAK